MVVKFVLFGQAHVTKRLLVLGKTQDAGKLSFLHSRRKFSAKKKKIFECRIGNCEDEEVRYQSPKLLFVEVNFLSPVLAN